MSKIRRVFHLLHLHGQVFELIKDQGEDKKMTLYSLVCDEKERVAKQAQNYLITDCGLKFGINKMSRVYVYTDMLGEKVELYSVIVDVGNSVRTRVSLDGYIGKWSTPKSVATPESRAIEWISNLKVKNAWTIFDLIASEDENFKKIIENNKVIDPI